MSQHSEQLEARFLALSARGKLTARGRRFAYLLETGRDERIAIEYPGLEFGFAAPVGGSGAASADAGGRSSPPAALPGERGAR